MARRRRESSEAETPTTLADAAGYATRDTLAVARRGIIATPHHETVLFNILQGFLGAFAFARLSTWGIRHVWWPAGDVHVSGRHIHHFVPGHRRWPSAQGSGPSPPATSASSRRSRSHSAWGWA